jgi:cyanophycinase
MFRNTINKLWLLSLLVVFACSVEDNIPDQPDNATNIMYRLLGDTTDVSTITTGGTCLMGGSTDVDAAFKWMIAKSGGGDFVVIRSDVSYDYNPYVRNLGNTNSVETIVIASVADAKNKKVASRIRNAEALFIAGGDQKDYVNFWKDTPVEEAINYLINTKHVPVGGTSAGCAILGSSYFSAIKGSVTSVQAMQNPYSTLVSLGNDDFIANPFLTNTITDQHYSQRDREGRLVTFMARMNTDLGKNPRAIAVDEETAVCVDKDGIATVFGINNAFFLQSSSSPETCVSGVPLTWNQNKQAVKVYRIAGSTTGNGSFDLNDFTTATGGTWLWYYVDNGVFYTDSSIYNSTGYLSH